MIDLSIITNWFNQIDKQGVDAIKKGIDAASKINTKIVDGQQFFISPTNLDISSKLKTPQSLKETKGKIDVSK